MKVVVKEKSSKKAIKFPKLMIGDDKEMVLFSDISIGVVVNDEYNRIGYYSTSWAMGWFKEFDGEVVLSND